MASACLATLVSASWAARRSVTSTSGCSERASPVVVKATGTFVRAVQLGDLRERVRQPRALELAGADRMDRRAAPP